MEVGPTQLGLALVIFVIALAALLGVLVDSNNHADYTTPGFTPPAITRTVTP